MAKKQHVMSLLILSSLILGLTGCTEMVADKHEPSHDTTVKETSTTTLKVEETNKKLLVNSIGVDVKLKVNEKDPKAFAIEGKKSIVQTYDDKDQLAIVLTQVTKKKNDTVTINVGQDSLKSVIIDLKNSNLEVEGEFKGDTLAVTSQKSKLVFADSIKTNDVSFKLEESNLEATDLEVSDATFTANQGSFKFDAVQSNTLDVDLVRGSFVTKETEGHLALSANQGDIKVGNIKGSAAIKVDEGSVIGNFKELEDALILEAQKGQVKLLLPEKLAFSYEAKGEKGTISTDFDDKLKIHDGLATGTVNSNPNVKVKVKAKGGAIDIRRPQKGENDKDAKNN